MDPQDEKLIEIMLKQYTLLRTEMMQSLQSQINILQFGLASVGVLIGAGIANWKTSDFYLPFVVFLLIIPTICYIVLAVWSGELMRMMRAGVFNADLEMKINALSKQKDLLNWENWLRRRDKKPTTPQITWSYLAIILLFFFVAAISTSLGVYRIKDEKDISQIVVSVYGLVVYLIAVIFVYSICKRIANDNKASSLPEANQTPVQPA